jgi:hypothetical protein
MDELESAPTPTVTESDRVAAAVMELIEAIVARIPGLEAPHPSSSRRVRGARTVSKEAILSMAGVAETFPELQRTFDIEAAYEMLQFNFALKPIVDALNAVAGRISYTMEAKKARVVFAMLQTYSIAQGLARDPANGNLHTLLEILGRELPRGRRRKRASPPAEE